MKVLIVEDRVLDVALTTRALSDCEIAHQFTIAGDGEEALQILTRKSFDLILLDLAMPRIDGFEFLNLLRQHTPDTAPVIVLSASNRESDRSRARALGAVDYVNKAFDFQEFRNQLHRALAHHGFC